MEYGNLTISNMETLNYFGFACECNADKKRVFLTKENK